MARDLQAAASGSRAQVPQARSSPPAPISSPASRLSTPIDEHSRSSSGRGSLKAKKKEEDSVLKSTTSTAPNTGNNVSDRRPPAKRKATSPPPSPARKMAPIMIRIKRPPRPASPVDPPATAPSDPLPRPTAPPTEPAPSFYDIELIGQVPHGDFDGVVIPGRQLGMSAFFVSLTGTRVPSGDAVCIKIARTEGRNGTKAKRHLEHERRVLDIIDHAGGHRGIMQFHGSRIGREGKIDFIMTQTSSMGTLADVMVANMAAKKLPITFESKLSVLRQLADAVLFLNGLGLQHRVICTDTILVESCTATGSPREVRLIELTSASDLKNRDRGYGKAPFEAPERRLVHKADRTVPTYLKDEDLPKADVYAIAMVFAAMVIRRPRPCSTWEPIMENVVVPIYEPERKTLVRDMLNPDPEQRANIQRVVDELRDPLPSMPGPSNPRRSNPLRASSAAAAVPAHVPGALTDSSNIPTKPKPEVKFEESGGPKKASGSKKGNAQNEY